MWCCDTTLTRKQKFHNPHTISSNEKFRKIIIVLQGNSCTHWMLKISITISFINYRKTHSRLKLHSASEFGRNCWWFDEWNARRDDLEVRRVISNSLSSRNFSDFLFFAYRSPCSSTQHSNLIIISSTTIHHIETISERIFMLWHSRRLRLKFIVC